MKLQANYFRANEIASFENIYITLFSNFIYIRYVKII